jgi:hypothetical protein
MRDFSAAGPKNIPGSLHFAQRWRAAVVNRWKLCLATLACIVIAGADAAKAYKTRPTKRYYRGSYAEYIVRKKKDGQTTVRQTYPGYSAGFPPPAFLYYGYPHSGDGTGIGPLDRR